MLEAKLQRVHGFSCPAQGLSVASLPKLREVRSARRFLRAPSVFDTYTRRI